MDKILVTRPSIPPIEEYYEEIKDIWESQWLTNMGPKHNQFKSKITEYLGVKQLDLLTNGHMALELTLQALELPEGGEVITTPFTFASTTHAIVRNRLKPVFCDINLNDYTLDVSKIESLITEKTCAIVPVHVYGNICDVDSIDNIAKKYGLKVLYDAAHAFGEELDGNGVGNFGDASCFSFHATKVFNTIEGGAVCYKNDELGRKLYNLKNFGIRSEEVVESVGANAKMNELCAAMGLCNLRYVEQNIGKRKIVVRKYQELLKDIPGVKLWTEQKGVKHNYAYFPIIVDEREYGVNRDELSDILSDNGIGARKYFYPITSAFDAYKGIYNPNDTPVALEVSKRVLTLPLYPELELDTICRIAEIIKHI